MRKWMLAVALFFGVALGLSAQVNMSGRIYHSSNIMDGEWNDIMKEVNLKVDSLKTDLVEKAKKEKGRELTAEEVKEINEKVKEAQHKMAEMKKAMTVEISVEFTSDKDLVMRHKMSVNDALLKKMGVGWLKRKSLKALCLLPGKEKGTYRVSGNLIIIEDEEEPDTMRLSQDGKHLQGKFDKKTKFTLTRTK
ncbi:MAG: hypothetical protein IJ066_01085 [Bacteroidaceae bacterium]|nr:hypothetical protein [Bacteroidaceae bacterium]